MTLKKKPPARKPSARKPSAKKPIATETTAVEPTLEEAVQAPQTQEGQPLYINLSEVPVGVLPLNDRVGVDVVVLATQYKQLTALEQISMSVHQLVAQQTATDTNQSLINENQELQTNYSTLYQQYTELYNLYEQLRLQYQAVAPSN